MTPERAGGTTWYPAVGMGLEPLDNIDHPLELRNHITAV
jgi:hypothetical protein